MGNLRKLGVAASVLAAGLGFSGKAEAQNQGKVVNPPPSPTDQRDVTGEPRYVRERNSRFFSSVGAPRECMGVRPVSGAAAERALTNNPNDVVDGGMKDWTQIRSDMLSCAAALGGNAEPYLRRRMIYSGVSSTGALGAAIGGASAAASTMNAWLGLALLPVVVEGTFDRPEFDHVDGVTAYSLNWVASRGDDLDRAQMLLQSHVNALDDLEEQLDEHIEDLSASMSDGDAASDRELIAAIERAIAAERRDAEEAPQPAADTQQTSESERLLNRLRARLDNRNRTGQRPVDAEVARESMSQLITDLVGLRGQARLAREAVAAQQSTISSELRGWGWEKFSEVMSVYSASRREMSLRPEAALRNVLALPLTTLSTFVRGQGQNPNANELYAVRTATNLRRIDPSIGLAPISVNNPGEVRADLSRFHPGDRLNVQRALDAARLLSDQASLALTTARTVQRMDGEQMPDVLNAPGAAPAPAPTAPPAAPPAPTPTPTESNGGGEEKEPAT